VLEDGSIDVVGHDLKRSLQALRGAGVALRGLVFDSMLASFVIDPGKRSHALEVLAREYLAIELRSVDGLRGKGKSARTLDLATTADLAECVCSRVVGIHDLRDHLERELDARGGQDLFTAIEMPLVHVLADLESAGIALDRDAMAMLAERFQVELVNLERCIYEEAGTDFNINSTPQLRHVLFEKLQLPVIKRTKTGASTDADVLAELAAMGHALPTLLLEYRGLAKLQSTYVEALPKSVDPNTGRIHTTFSQTGAATGRLSSSDPNLQNIPIRTQRGEEIRRCFVAPEGSSLLVADYSQIELRLLAHLSQDAAFLNAFRQGDDVHRQTASMIFDIAVDEVTSEMRGRAKTINFATIYGQGAFSLARQLGISQEEAKDFIRLYFERFSGVRRYLDDCVEKARRQGYAETLFGRRRYIPELKDRNFNVRAFGERVAMNSPLQGSAADLIKRAMIEIWRALHAASRESRLLLQVHDELVVESQHDEIDAVTDIVRHEMEGAAELAVPLVVDIGVGPNWVDAKA
jgi:DNA polymerase I